MPLVRKDPAPAKPADAAGDAAARLTAGTPDERWAAARELGAAPEGVPALAQALTAETEPRVREAVLTGLARHGGEDAVAAVTPLLRSDDADLRTAALDALVTMPAAAAQARALLADRDPDVRILACELARALPTAEATALLSEVLTREPEVNVCASAVEVLAEVGDASALPALAACAQRFGEQPFLGFAIRVAGERIGASRGG